LKNKRKEVKKMTEMRDLGTDITRIQLCGVQGCCPTVEIHHDTGKVIIADDNGGKVTLTKEQWQEALAKAKVNA
ncbi:hypothetical protein COY35_01540, partial [candidate division WWE3 bacterium CG_4_10_14_0_2_um_filter_47_8]